MQLSINMSNKQIIAIAMYIMISLFLMIFLNIAFLDRLENTEVVCLFHLLALLTITSLTLQSIFNYCNLCLLLSGVFFYGQIVVKLSGVSVFEGIDVYTIADNWLINETLVFIMFSLHFLCLGYIFHRFLFCRKKNNKLNISTSNRKLIYSVGLRLFQLGAIPKLFIDISRLYFFSIHSYNLKYIANSIGYLNILSNFSEYGIIIMLVSRFKSHKFARNIVIASLLYQLLPIMTGVRARPIVFAISLLYFYFKMYKSFTAKDYVKCSIVGYFLLMFSNVISQIRQVGLSINIFLSSLSNNMSNPLLTALQEFGNTLGSVCYTVMLFNDKNFELSNFANPVIRVINIFPNIGGFLQYFEKIFYINTNFDRSLPHAISLGGSFLCELYFDFGQYGCLMGIFIGLLVGYINFKSEEIIKGNCIRPIIFILPLFCNVLWWIRDNFIVIAREYTWNLVLILFILTAFRYQKRKKYSNNCCIDDSIERTMRVK